VDTEQRVRCGPRLDGVRGGSGLLGDQGRQRLRVAREDLPLAGEQGRALRSHAGDGPKLPRRRVFLFEIEHTALSEQEPPEGREDALAGLALADRREQVLLEGLQTAVEEVLLGRDVWTPMPILPTGAEALLNVREFSDAPGHVP
jgi:hypothetical protein